MISPAILSSAEVVMRVCGIVRLKMGDEKRWERDHEKRFAPDYENLSPQPLDQTRPNERHWRELPLSIETGSPGLCDRPPLRWTISHIR